jgi:hypothetical protein
MPTTSAAPPRASNGGDLVARDSAIVVDVDRRQARALLFDIVDGAARFIALGIGALTDSASDGASTAVSRALRRLERETGRQFVDGDTLITPQQANGDGVDAYYVTGAPVEPMRAAVIWTGSDTIAGQVIAGIRRTNTLVGDARGDLLQAGSPFSPPALLAWLQAVRPSTVIFIHEGGSAEEWDIAIEAVADAAREGELANGIVVADEAHQQTVAQSLGSLIELSGIDPADYAVWEIALALETEFRDQYARKIEASPTLHLFANAPFVDRIQATQAVAAFLHRRMSRNVLSLQIGDGTLLHSASKRGGVTVCRVERDFGRGARSLLSLEPEQVARWLPFRWSPEEITQWLLNRALRPTVEAEATTDLFVEAAVQREVIGDLLRGAGVNGAADVDLITVGPGFCADDDGLTLLTILDGVMPHSADGQVTIALDAEGLMPALGAISSRDPGFAREVIEQDFLTPLATIIVVEGRGEDGSLAVRGAVTFAGSEPQRFSVPFGSVHVLPLHEGASADITLTMEPGFQIGNRAGQDTVSFTGDHQVFGGRIGVVIDARGRPIRLPDEPELRATRLRAWLGDVGSQLR